MEVVGRYTDFNVAVAPVKLKPQRQVFRRLPVIQEAPAPIVESLYTEYLTDSELEGIYTQMTLGRVARQQLLSLNGNFPKSTYQKLIKE